MARWILRAATYVLSFADKNLQIFANATAVHLVLPLLCRPLGWRRKRRSPLLTIAAITLAGPRFFNRLHLFERVRTG